MPQCRPDRATEPGPPRACPPNPADDRDGHPGEARARDRGRRARPDPCRSDGWRRPGRAAARPQDPASAGRSRGRHPGGAALQRPVFNPSARLAVGDRHAAARAYGDPYRPPEPRQLPSRGHRRAGAFSRASTASDGSRFHASPSFNGGARAGNEGTRQQRQAGNRRKRERTDEVVRLRESGIYL